MDEAHRLGGSTDQVARFKLGQGLAEAAPYFLMLSATPHQGKTDAFHRPVSLIDSQAFPGVGSVTRDRVQPYVIRTEKRQAIDADGKPLFKPRRTEPFQPSDLLRVLLRRHYRGKRIPAILDQRFIQILRQNRIFVDWPLEKIVSDRESFLLFLQERWPIFLNRMAFHDNQSAYEDKNPYNLEYPGPLDLPFSHDDIRIYIDNFFVEGILQPISHFKADILSKNWVSVGIVSDPQSNNKRRIQRLLDSIENSLPKEDDRHGDWLHFAFRWAELTALVFKTESEINEDTCRKIELIRNKLEQSFYCWIQKRYAGLVNLPPVPPAMLHHVPRFLSRKTGVSRQEKLALVVVDGLSLDQWIVLREVLSTQLSKLNFRENAVFAWIPSITSVSRQATFAGKPPIYFPSSIDTTDKESVLWKQFWIDQGLTQLQIVFAKGLSNGNLDTVKEIVTHPKVRVVGLVVDKIDKIMHGMELGSAGMHNQVRQWATQGFMSYLLELLLEHNFQIYLTSDHGNIEAKGCGRPKEEVIADLRGERVRIYPDKLLRSKSKNAFPETIEWPSIGLPDDYHVLLAPNRQAFIPENKTTVGHGGISLEELIVPLIHIERRET